MVLLLLLTAGTSLSLSGEEKNTALAWDRLVIETSVKPVDRVAEAWFTFSNTSAKPVRIMSTKSDCDCLIPQLDRKVYYPGEDGLLLATVQLDPIKDPSRLEKRILVLIEEADGAQRQTELKIIITRNGTPGADTPAIGIP